MKLTIYDATLREGAQGAQASLTVQDKIRTVRMLDQLGVHYIEAGNPGSNPKDAELYRLMAHEPPRSARLAAFGSTCRPGVLPDQDPNVLALLKADTPVVCVFGKAWDLHVTRVLNTGLKDNVDIIEQTVRYLKSCGREVVYDAEHFFDGFRNNRVYALETLQAAARAGADWLCLCDTNGGCFPHEVDEIVTAVAGLHRIPLGVHCHNDTGMAAANSIAAARAGAKMIQVTLNGCGERCGNADLCTLVPNLQLKLGYSCIPPHSMRHLTKVSRAFSQLTNLRHDSRAPYVGADAFAHKAGMHIDAVSKIPLSFEHVPPESVGGERSFLLSEVAGRMAIVAKARQVAPMLKKDSPQAQSILDRLKELEHGGYQFEGAEASFELLVRRELGMYQPHFDLQGFKVIVSQPAPDGQTAAAMIEVVVNGQREITADVGNGPVNALDRAARKALERFYPSLRDTHLIDYKVRVLDGGQATASVVRVTIESTDGNDRWTTVGVSTDIIEASWKALVDSLEYKLIGEEGAGA